MHMARRFEFEALEARHDAFLRLATGPVCCTLGTEPGHREALAFLLHPSSVFGVRNMFDEALLYLVPYGIYRGLEAKQLLGTDTFMLGSKYAPLLPRGRLFSSPAPFLNFGGSDLDCES